MFESMFAKVVVGTLGAGMCIGVGYLIARASRNKDTVLNDAADGVLLKQQQMEMKIEDLKNKFNTKFSSK